MGAMSGVTPTRAVRSGLSFLDSHRLPTSVEPLTPPTPTYAKTMLAPTDMQESTLSHNEFALCLRSLLRPSSALSPCEFATCMHRSPTWAVLRALQQIYSATRIEGEAAMSAPPFFQVAGRGDLILFFFRTRKEKLAGRVEHDARLGRLVQVKKRGRGNPLI